MSPTSIHPAEPRGRDFPAGFPLTRAALGFARDRHAGQRRRLRDEPFVAHPVEVAELLRDAGYPDEVVAAGVLHDVIEDTETGPDELRRRFGPQVAEYVLAVSDDPSIEDEAERKAALRRQVASAGARAAAIFAADKVSKARELRFIAARRGLSAPDRLKAAHYRESFEMLSELMPDDPLVRRLGLELEALGALSAR